MKLPCKFSCDDVPEKSLDFGNGAVQDDNRAPWQVMITDALDRWKISISFIGNHFQKILVEPRDAWRLSPILSEWSDAQEDFVAQEVEGFCCVDWVLEPEDGDLALRPDQGNWTKNGLKRNLAAFSEWLLKEVPAKKDDWPESSFES